MHELRNVLTRRKLDYVFVFVIFFALAVYWQFTATIGDPDGFYHAKIALFLSHGVLLKSLPWMQFSTLRDAFTDHHFLYHVLLVPFVKLGNPLIGVKLATAVFVSSFFTVFYWFLKRLHAHAPFLCTLLLALTASFTFRISLIKANALSLIVFLLIFDALLEKRWALLFALNFLYVWLYGGWLLAWVLVFFHATVAIIYRRPRGDAQSAGSGPKRLVGLLKGAAATIGGSAAGVIINPYFPQNLYFYWQQVWQISIVNLGNKLNVGGEWTSLAPQELAVFFQYLLIFYGIGIFFVLVERRRIRFRTWLTLLLSLFFIVFTVKSRRYIELSAPLSVLFAAFAWSDSVPPRFLADLFRSWRPPKEGLKHTIGFAAILGIVIFSFLPNLGLWSQIRLVRAQLTGGLPFHRYEKVSLWLAAHTPPRSIVLHSDWDDWPMLFYHNDHNYYIVGLDPTFMYNYDKTLYDRWAQLTGSGRADDTRGLVTRELRAQYVMIEKDHLAMNSLFKENIYFRRIYEDDEVWVYEPVGDRQKRGMGTNGPDR